MNLLIVDSNDKVVLITGGTGSFGKKFAETVLRRYDVRKLIIFSLDELKRFDMRNDPFLRKHEKRMEFVSGRTSLCKMMCSSSA